MQVHVLPERGGVREETPKGTSPLQYNQPFLDIGLHVTFILFLAIF